MRAAAIATIVLMAAACSTDPKDGDGSTDPDVGVDGGGGADASDGDDAEGFDVGTKEDAGGAAVGEPCVEVSDCLEGLECRSAEESRWNFCGASMEPMCDDGEIGDNCGNCFTSCTGDDDCTGEMTCNGTYCISERACGEERQPPP